MFKKVYIYINEFLTGPIYQILDKYFILKKDYLFPLYLKIPNLVIFTEFL